MFCGQHNFTWLPSACGWEDHAHIFIFGWTVPLRRKIQSWVRFLKTESFDPRRHKKDTCTIPSRIVSKQQFHRTETNTCKTEVWQISSKDMLFLDLGWDSKPAQINDRDTEQWGTFFYSRFSLDNQSKHRLPSGDRASPWSLTVDYYTTVNARLWEMSGDRKDSFDCSESACRKWLYCAWRTSWWEANMAKTSPLIQQ